MRALIVVLLLIVVAAFVIVIGRGYIVANWEMANDAGIRNPTSAATATRAIALANDDESQKAAALPINAFREMLADDIEPAMKVLQEVFSEQIANGSIKLSFKTTNRGTAVLGISVAASDVPVFNQFSQLTEVLYAAVNADDTVPLPPRKSSEMRKYDLKDRDVKQVVEAVTELLREEVVKGTMAVVGNFQTKTLYVAGAPGALVRVAPFVEAATKGPAVPGLPGAVPEQWEPEIETKVFTLKNASATELSLVLSELYPLANTRIVPDGRSNTLWVRAPWVWLAKIEATVLKLDELPAHPAVGPTNAKVLEGPDPGSDSLIPVDRRQLAQTYRELDRDAAGFAAQLQGLNAAAQPDQPRVEQATAQLRSAVTQAFDARQRWQAAELAVLRTRVQRLEREIKARAQAKSQIMERRVRELIESEQSSDDADPFADNTQSRRASQSPMRPSDSARLPATPDSSIAPLRQILLQKLTDAEVERELMRGNVTAQREELERYSKMPPRVDDRDVERLVAADEAMQTLQQGLQRTLRGIETMLNNQDEKKAAAKLRLRIDERRQQLRRLAEEKVIAAKRASLAEAEAALRSRERIAELLRLKVGELSQSTSSKSETEEATRGHPVRSDANAKPPDSSAAPQVDADETGDVRQRMIKAEASVDDAWQMLKKARASLTHAVDQQKNGRLDGLKEGDPQFEILKNRVVAAEIHEAGALQSLKASEKRAQLTRDELLARVRQFELDLADAEARLEKVKLDGASMRRAVEKGIVSPTALPMTTVELRSAQSDVERAKIQLDLYRKALPKKAEEPLPAELPDESATKAKELKRPLLMYADPPTQTLELESQKEWMADPEVLDLLEKYFVAVRRVERNLHGDEAQSFPLVEIVDFLPTRPGVEGKQHAALAKFHYDKRFLDLLRRIAAEHAEAKKTEGPKHKDATIDESLDVPKPKSQQRR